MKYSFKFLVVAGLAISMLNSCGVKYIEKGFGGGCGEHHTTTLQHSTETIHHVSSIKNSKEMNPIGTINECQLSEVNILPKLTQNEPKLSFVQKIKLAQKIRKNIQNASEVNCTNPNKIKDSKVVNGRKSFKQMKNDFDTSELGIIKLVLVILLALLILGLVNQLLGISLINLLVLLLLIYLIWVYLF